METGALGKKIFFVYPPQVLTEVVDELARQEFEVYLSKDHGKLRRVYIQSMRAEAPSVGIGIVTLNDNAELREFYLMNAQIQCGFIILKIGATKTAEILAKTLDANEARGRRKFVRAVCAPGVGQCLANDEGATIKADLTDLSSAGMAIRIGGGGSVKVGTVLRDMTITIKGQRLLVSGVVVAKRADSSGTEPVSVIMFSPGSLDEARREKLKTLVFRVNQTAMEIILERS
jgi:PilZ domain